MEYTGPTLWLKSCPRDGDGDLQLEKDQYGYYIHCLQCGYHLTDAQFGLFTRGWSTPMKNSVPYALSATPSRN